MSCRRSLEVDLAGFLADPRAEAHRAFRAHYPRCSVCSAEVRAWTELHGRLAPEHPEPERLARYAGLSAEERAAVDDHLAGCPSCREERAQLDGFDATRLAAALEAPAAPERPAAGGWLEALRRLLWHPAFAYGLAGLLLLPVLLRTLERAEPSRVSAPAAEAPRSLEDETAFAQPALERSFAPAEPLPQERERRDLAASASSLAEADVGVGALRLEAGGTLAVGPLPPDELLRLCLALPPGGRAGWAQLRVVAPEGERELRERLALASQARELVVGLPHAWLRPGRYGLELALPGAAQPLHFELVVRGRAPAQSSTSSRMDASPGTPTRSGKP